MEGFMKRIVMEVLFGVLVLLPMICSAAWVIHLKDGRSFTTPEFHDDGDQISFKRYGGLIGLPRDQVLDIQEIANEPEKEVPKAKEEPSAPESREETATVKAEPPVSENREKAVTDQESTQEPPGDEKGKDEDKKKEDPQIALMKEKRRILSERENVSQAFKAAKAKNDRKEKDLYWNRLLQIQNELQQLQKKATAENKGILPPWWAQIQ